MKTTHLFSTLTLAAAVLPLVAQTSAAHHPASATHAAHALHSEAAGCATVPELSSKIPALPAGTPCPKVLFRFTTSPSIRLDYVSPLVSEALVDELGVKPTTFEEDYADIKVGTGELAQPKMYYTLQYTGYLVDGTQFDTSVGKPEPFTFPVGAHRVIPGWDIGFQGMRVGGKRRLYIPYQLAYGEHGRPPIPEKAELIFDIELLSQSADAPKPPASPAAPAKPVTATPAAKPAEPATPPTAEKH
jgi:peptidylprolyl isomerase